MGCLYQLTFQSGKSYIGITSKTLKRRLIVHKSHARTGRNMPLHKAIRKYDHFDSKMLVIADDWKYLCDLEKKAILAFDTVTPNGYNVSLGGEGVIGVPRSDDTRRKISERTKKLSIIKNGLPGRIGNKATLGYRHTDEAKKKIAEAGIGRVFSEQSKKKMSLSKMGHPVSDETRKKIGDANRRKR